MMETPSRKSGAPTGISRVTTLRFGRQIVRFRRRQTSPNSLARILANFAVVRPRRTLAGTLWREFWRTSTHSASDTSPKHVRLDCGETPETAFIPGQSPGLPAKAGESPFNCRTILAGIILCVFMILLVQFALIVKADRMATDHMPAGGVVVFFIMCVFINPLLKVVTRKRFSFSGSELLVIWTMLLVAASVAEMGLVAQFFAILAGLRYYATPQNRWAELILPQLKDWLVPKDFTVVRGFFEGSNTVPWGYWLKICLPWLFFVLCLYFVSICIVSIFRKQWVEKERLLFPLNALPLAMAEETEGGIVSPLFKNKLMWIGFGCAFLFSSLYGLAVFFPLVQPIPQNQAIPIFRGTVQFMVALSLPVMGFIYFANTEVSFSLWIFALFFYALNGYFNILGISSAENLGAGSYYSVGGPIFAHLSTGAFLGFVFFSIWVSRKHLREVAEKAIRKNDAIDDSQELLSYRTSFWGMIIGIFLLVLWLRAAGMNTLVALLFVLLVFVFLFGLTKIIAQAGLVTLKPPSIASSQIISSLGSGNLTPGTLSNLGLNYAHHSELRTFPFCAVFHGAKLGQKIGGGLRPLFWATMLSLVVGILVSSVILLKLAYGYGGVNMNDWFFKSVAQFPHQTIAYHLLHPKDVIVSGIAYKAVGLALMFLLMFLHGRFLWWPLHPIGLAAASNARVMYPWFSIFLGWLLKVLILRYGGVKMYRNLKPFFFGLILGTYSAAGVWFVIGLLTGREISRIFYI